MPESLHIPVLLKCPVILVLYCCFASLIQWDRLAVAVASPAVPPDLKAASQALRSLSTSPVSHCTNSDICAVTDIIDSFCDVCYNSTCVLLYICVVIISGCLFENVPVSSVKTVLQSIGGPLWPHMYLLLCWSDGSHSGSVCRSHYDGDVIRDTQMGELGGFVCSLTGCVHHIQ